MLTGCASSAVDSAGTDGSADTDVGTSPDTGTPGALDACTADRLGPCVLPNAINHIGYRQANKVIKFALAPDKVGCDLDADGTVDNVLGKAVDIYPAINDDFAVSLQDGSEVLIFAPDAWPTNKTPFSIDLLRGHIAVGHAPCDPTIAGGCSYGVGPHNYVSASTPGGVCAAKTSLFPATIDGDQLVAGGEGQSFSQTVTLVGFVLPIIIRRLRLRGTVTGAATWTSLKDGLLCGVYLQADLHAAIDAVPTDVLKDTGFDKATIKDLIGGVWAPDIDTDGDGIADGISVAFALETAVATVGLCTP